MKKQPEVTAQTKRNLMDAFWSLYCMKRIEKISVKEITARAGYNRATFYEYFSDIYDVLDQIEHCLLPNLDEFLPMDITSKETGLPVDAVIRMFQEHSQYYVVLLGEHGDPSFHNKMKNAMKPLLKQKFCVKGVADDYQLDYILEYTLAAMIGILNYWFRQEDPPPAEKLVKLIYDLMQNGVIKKLQFL